MVPRLGIALALGLVCCRVGYAQAPVIEGVRWPLELTIKGTVGTTNWILSADSLMPWAWKVVTNLVVSTSPYVFADPETSSPRRFYQVMEGASAPLIPGFAPDPGGFVYIQPGTFTMGSPDTEPGRYTFEGPQTVVTLTKGFWMGKYEVTQGQYRSVMGSNPSQFAGNSTRPVENVSWIGATNYCALLTAQQRAAGRLPAGYVYRLPTEAEWEYAARAGTTTRFSYGDDPDYSQLGNYAWYLSNSGGTTHPVGQKQPNPWGLYDMSGNVWELCADWWEYSLPGGSVTDPTGPGSGAYVVVRCGGYNNADWEHRSATRTGFPPHVGDPNTGFRVVLAPSAEFTPDPTRFAYVPPGTFTMGSPATEQDRLGDEGPQTVVTLTKGFWMGKYEVTQGEYLAVVGGNPSRFTGDPNRPVEQLSWTDATNYCARLTAQERAAGRLPAGWAYRLPTEAEWEYAARAGTTTRFSYGDDPGYGQLGGYAWYLSNSGGTTHPVGEKQPNPWGLYDMSGNVWEWCSDWYATYPGGSVTDPVGPGSGSFRVLRGGGCYVGGLDCRSANRDDLAPDFRRYYVGFRAVLAAGPP
jgi:formylglycine-generating enzyme required for sulfatase activity